jgi:AcrR family transcriptional regulator
VARWEPGSRERLQQAALDLFSEQGFEHTTVSEIAARVGVDKRTFFRHFADKREVLFAGAEDLQSSLVETIAGAPSELASLDAIASVVAVIDWEQTAPLTALRKRQAAIEASTELMERELMKFEALTAAFAQGLRRRGTDDAAADLAAHAGMTVFRTSYERFIDPDNNVDLAQIVNDVLDELRAAVGA